MDDSSERYYVCQICGSVQARLPEERCEICRQDPASYGYVDPAVLFGAT